VAQRRQEQKEKEEQERAMREEMERLEQVSTFTNAFRLLQALTLHETMRTVSGQSEHGQIVVQTERGWAERALHPVTQNKRTHLKKSTVTVATRGAISVPSAPIHRLSNMSCVLLWHCVNGSYYPGHLRRRPSCDGFAHLFGARWHDRDFLGNDSNEGSRELICRLVV
jgi:hypothetical protein